MNKPKRELPGEFTEKLKNLVPAPHWSKVLKSFSQEKPCTFRVNALKLASSSLKERLEPLGFKVENVLWYRDAFLLRKGEQKDLEKTPFYKNGEIYVQGLSSMIPPLVLDPRPGDRVLDLTAAPGSKTTQMAALMKGQGSVTANDNNPIRVEKLKANAALQGASNVEVLPAGDGGLVWKERFEAFDKVLLDAPCSSEGRFLVEVPSTYGYWREDTNRKMAKDQRRLFKSAFLALKPGGTMVYSTCTFAPEENEMVLQWALETYGDALKLEKISMPLPAMTGGLARWGDLNFDPQVLSSLRVLPNQDMEGFFVAKLTKLKSVEAPEPFVPSSKN
ncbi:MAG TPA: RsmB/NOP family class I SAM-dependent RNA methyltransferase [bacterium]|nr:RsmB/NOP family class I SAM-dependent RNA methyltransferase [bacterium]